MSKTLFGIIGLLLGLMLGELPGALVGLVLGVGLALVIPPKRKSEEPAAGGAPAGPARPLEARVASLEAQVRALRAEVQRLNQRDAGVAAEASSGEADIAQESSAEMSPADAPSPIPMQAAVASRRASIEVAAAAVPAAVTPPTVASQPEPEAAATMSTANAVPPAAAADEPAPNAARTRLPLPPRPPAPPPIPLKDRLPPVVRDWVFGGNTIVKIGVLILFLGLAFLLRYAAERVVVPVGVRYAGVALLGLGLLGLGWRLRERRDAAGGSGYGLILQGAGIGVLYLTTLASLKFGELLDPAPAFVFLLAVSVLSAVLAVVQNAPWLAYVAAAEGFAVPVLVSSGGGNHHVLFSYLALLDVGVILIAWFKAWRPLNLIAFVGTFTLAGAWAQGHYDDALYAGVQAYLLLFFALFTAIGVLFARRALALGPVQDAADALAQRAAQALAQVGRVDSTLVFGVPLVAYGLQYLLVKNWEYGPAWAALAFSMIYLLLGTVTMRGGAPRYALLGEAYVIVSVIFGTLAIPLALEGTWTGATWAIEAAGMYWLGTRQHRRYARAFALLVLAGAAVRSFSSLGLDESPGTPLLSGSLMGLALLAAGTLAMLAVSVKDWRDAGAAPAGWERAGQGGQLAIAAAALSAMAWVVWVPAWACVATSALALAMAWLPARWRPQALSWAVAGLQAVALGGFAATLHVLHGEAMLGNGWQGLVAALLIGASVLATAVLALPAGWRSLWGAPDASDAAPAAWPLGTLAGVLAGLTAIGLAALFVWPADEAARLWPWLGLAALWAGLRTGQAPLVLAGLVAQAIAGGAFLAYGPPSWWQNTPGPTWWAPLMLAAAALAGGDCARRAAALANGPAWLRQPALQWALVAWAWLWWSQALPPELYRYLHRTQDDWPGWWAMALVGWVLLSSAGMTALARWRRWAVAGQSTWATVPALALLAWIQASVVGEAPHAHGGWLLWPLALAWHLGLLRQQARWAGVVAQAAMHLLGFWLFVVLGAREGQQLLASAGATDSAWAALAWVLMPAAVLALVTRPALQRRWPIDTFPVTYLLHACAPVAAYLMLWVWLSNTLPGDAAPLPFVPLLNPLELGHALVLLALLLWFRALPAETQATLPRPLLLGGLGATAFVLYTGLLLRACHHAAGVPWTASALFGSTLAQATLSVAWALLGVGLMVLGHKRARRAVWVVGAALLALVVAKLFFVELADHGGVYRIVSFIVVGLLLLLVGYFAPVPPRRDSAPAREVAA
jgi:uncharacterized membrane protein